MEPLDRGRSRDGGGWNRDGTVSATFATSINFDTMIDQSDSHDQV